MVGIYSRVSCPLKLRNLYSRIQQLLAEHLWHHIQSDFDQSTVHRELTFSEKEDLDEKVAILIILQHSLSYLCNHLFLFCITKVNLYLLTWI